MSVRVDPRIILKQVWGYDAFRPQQEAAVRAMLEGRDSLVVMPTGGGKSICYQLPAILRGDTVVVVSPLIALMKDQVDQLRDRDIPAAALNSSISSAEQQEIRNELLAGNLRLLFVSPERLAMDGFRSMLSRVNVRSFAIDESHCISHWGHDFRPEYRQIGQLREFFPEASFHAFTATATDKVRNDIIDQLQLREPEVLVGSFDRPNLTYRFIPRSEGWQKEIEAVIARHPGEAGIIYCISKKNVDELCTALQKKKIRALPYHAGLPPQIRRQTQEDFMEEKCDVIVATVAFGMGIDRSNVRFVIHRGMPKSPEHYQQEAGRGGRDGLPSECLLLYSWEDVKIWEFVLKKAEEDADLNSKPSAEELQSRRNALNSIKAMFRFCDAPVCRHRQMVGYFDQTYPHLYCGACDLCLRHVRRVGDSLMNTQKILSGVARLEEKYSIEHLVELLLGRQTTRIEAASHHLLPTYGLFADVDEAIVRDWIRQLIEQNFLKLEGAEHIVKLGIPRNLIRQPLTMPLLLEPADRSSQGDKGIDPDLLETLRKVRQEVAAEHHLPPDTIFGDITLREMARIRPSRPEQLINIYGVGEAKARRYGRRFMEAIAPFVPVVVPATKGRISRTPTPPVRDSSVEEALLKAIIEAPDDLQPRRKFAEWVKKYDPEQSEYVSISCDLEEMSAKDPRRNSLLNQSDELLQKNRARWLGKLAPILEACRWRAGFPEKATVKIEAFAMNLSLVFHQIPLRDVTLTGAEWLLKGVLTSPHMVNLRSLSLRGIPISSGLLGDFAGRKAPLKLEKLDLSETGIDDACLDAICFSERFARLRTLLLAGNVQLGDEGAESLLVTQTLVDLEEIDLRRCPGLSPGMRKQLKDAFAERIWLD